MDRASAACAALGCATFFGEIFLAGVSWGVVAAVPWAVGLLGRALRSARRTA